METRNIPKDLVILDVEPVEITNPFSGQSTTLEPDAVAVYDWIMGSQVLENYTDMRKGLNWFRKHEPEAYMILLD